MDNPGVFATNQYTTMEPCSARTSSTSDARDHRKCTERAANRLLPVDFAVPASLSTTRALVAGGCLPCQSLRLGESRLALAGGVSLLISPAVTVGFSKLQAMAPDGRCKAFDARANGFVRGEGAGIVVLKTLTNAVADGDRIYAVIRGGAINQDGRTNGLTAPNGLSQEALLRQAFSNAGVTSAELQYVEAHGTGTALGDPISSMPLVRVLAAGRSRDSPVRRGIGQDELRSSRGRRWHRRPD
jgi:hypothetical protein